MTVSARRDLSIEIENLDAVTEAMAAKIPELETVLEAKMQALHIEMANRVASGKLSGNPLNERSGNLKASVIESPRTTVEGDVISSIVGSDLVYARIHELGGDIYPVNARKLVFTIDGKTIFSDHVTMPARPYLAPTLLEMQPEIEAGLREAIFEVLTGD